MKKISKSKFVKIADLIVLIVIVLLGLFAFLHIREKKLKDYPYTHVDEVYEVKQSEWTMLVYMCGSDLEYRSGLCSKNINDMLLAAPGNDLQVAIETGGTSKWHGEYFTNNQTDLPKDGALDRFIVEGNRLTRIDEVETSSMVNKDTLCDFLKWGMKNAPANHYILVLWDHGSGSAIGYGRDMLYTKEKAMSVTDIAKAIEESGIKLDILGFDACLMGGVETGVALSDSAQYMIASEETEPGDGWNYKELIAYLDNNKDATSYSIAEIIINDYIKVGDTLSLIELNKVPAVRDALYDYLSRPCTFAELSKIRTNTKSFGKEMFDIIDIGDYIEKSQEYDTIGNLSDTTKEKLNKVILSLKEAVVINGSRNGDTCGLSFYYPYKFPNNYEEKADYLTDNQLWSPKSRTYFDTFINSLLEGAEVQSDLTGELVEIDDEYAVILNHDEFNRLSDVRLTVFLNEGDANLLQGYDFYFDHTVEDDKDYLWYFNPGTQLYFEDDRVAFFATDYIERDNGTFELRGNIPARLNNETNILINIRFDENHMLDANILGYTVTDDLSDGISSRDYLEFKVGDKIEFLFDYYDKDMKYIKTDTYSENLSYTFGRDYKANPPEIAYYPSSREDRVICYTITDIYLNEYITEGRLFEKSNQIDEDIKVNTFIE